VTKYLHHRKWQLWAGRAAEWRAGLRRSARRGFAERAGLSVGGVRLVPPCFEPSSVALTRAQQRVLEVIVARWMLRSVSSGPTAVARELGLTKGTVFPHMTSLLSRGLIYRCPGDAHAGEYIPSWRSLEGLRAITVPASVPALSAGGGR
jgi:hypothetical protein